MPRRNYKPVDECRQYVRRYIRSLESSTDDQDTEMRGSGSTTRYNQDLRWFDHWLDTHPGDEVTYFVNDDGGASAEDGNVWLESASDLTEDKAQLLGMDLSEEFNGTTPRYRWDRISAFYDFLDRIGVVDRNPLD